MLRHSVLSRLEWRRYGSSRYIENPISKMLIIPTEN